MKKLVPWTLPFTLVLGAVVLLPLSVPTGGQTPDRLRDCCRSPLDCCGFPDWGLRHHLHPESASPVPTTGGQEALMAMQQVSALLLSDGATDWSQVSVGRLRQWLVDWNRLALESEVVERPVEGGVEAIVTGDEATLAAVRRLVPRHLERLSSMEERSTAEDSEEGSSFRGWQLESEDLGDRIRVTLRSVDEEEVEVVRALGFFGLMSSGVYRPYELLAVARGVAE